MTSLDGLFDRDPGLFREAGVLARLVLEQTFRDKGMPDSDVAGMADRVVVELGEQFGGDDAELGGLGEQSDDHDAEVIGILDHLADRLCSVIKNRRDPAALRGQVATLGSVVALAKEDRAGKSRWATLALMLYLANPVTFTLDPAHGFEISNTPLIENIARRTLESIDRAVAAWEAVELARAGEAGRPAPPSARHPGHPNVTEQAGRVQTTPDAHPPGGRRPADQTPGPEAHAPVPTSPARAAIIVAWDTAEAEYKVWIDSKALSDKLFGQDEERLFRSLEQSRVAVGADNFGIPDRELAIRLRDHVRDQLNSRLLTRNLPANLYDRLFVSQGRDWTREAVMTFDVGLIPVWVPSSAASAETNHEVVYRLAVRVQTARLFRTKSWREIHGALDRVLLGAGSIRQIREVNTLVRRPSGNRHRRWRVGERHIRHGHSVSTADRPAGTVTTIVRDTGNHDFLIVTAGHVVGDRLLPAFGRGRPAYSPAFSDPSDAPIGVVEQVDLFTRPWSDLGAPALRSPAEFDVASVRFDAMGRVATEALRREEGALTLTRRTIALSDADVIAQNRLILGTGFTAFTNGRVTAVDTRVNVTDTRTGRAVCATGLIEVSPDYAAEPGDSGKPCYDQGGNLLGLVVAGTRRAHIDRAEADARPLVYVQPVHDLFRMRNWEIV